MEQILFIDIIKSIIVDLPEYHKLLFLSSNKYLHGIKNMITWNTPISIHFGPILSYCNNFSKIKIDRSKYKIKKMVRQMKKLNVYIDNYFAFATEIILVTAISDELVKFLIPSSVTHCKIRNRYTNLRILPTNISHLYLEYRYNIAHFNNWFDDINLPICSSITHLTIGICFCPCEWTNCRIPDTIYHLYVSNCNDGLHMVLPSSLTSLSLESDNWCNHNFNPSFNPSRLTNLSFSDSSQIFIDKVYPLVTHLKIGYYQADNSLASLKYFPSISHLTVGSDSYICCSVSRIPMLTSTIIYLKFGTFCNFWVDLFQSNLVYIIFSHFFNQNIDGCIPISCKYLEFGTRFRKKISISVLQQVSQIKIYKMYPHFELINKYFQGELVVYQKKN